MKVSVIAAVKNKPSKAWLAALKAQGANEIIVETKGTIGEARNAAISRAKHEIIAVTDDGCEYEKDWLKKLVMPVERGFDIVYGKYRAKVVDEFTRCFDIIVCGKHGSHRNMAFNKNRVGLKYQAWSVGEDTYWNKLAEEAGYSVTYSDATVWWEGCKNHAHLWKKFEWYGRGDAKIFSDLPLRYKAMVYLWPLNMFYVFFESWKFAYDCESLVGFTLNFVRRLAWIKGVWYGFLESTK